MSVGERVEAYADAADHMRQTHKGTPHEPNETTEGLSTDSPEIIAWCASVIGETLDDVIAAAKEGGATVRVVNRDGRPCVVTRDFKPHRLNVHVASDTVEGPYRVTALGGWG